VALRALCGSVFPMSGIGFSPAEENFGKYCGILDREVSAGGAKGYYSFGGRHRMTFSRAQHGAHRERVCPWDLSRDEFCGSVYFFAPIGNLKHRATESFGNRAEGFQSWFSIITRSWVTHSARLYLPHPLSVPSVALCFQRPRVLF
jgi:hypothetical protein